MSIQNNHWVPSIGDPTILGWITVFAYFLVAIICIQAMTSVNSNKSENLFWLFLTIFLVALGINKQLDLQSLLTQVGRDFAIEQGWYKDRRTVQMIFIILIGLLGVTGTAVLLKIYWNANTAIKIAFSGCIILFAFILIRASSFHHMDMFINMKLADVRINGILELGGLAIIGVGGFKYSKSNS